jgi:cyclopropane fatty-acyl-phospholipid synthase-like methyltransferase
MSVRPSPQLGPDAVDHALVDLAYELLDAHADTARMAMDEAGEDEWRNHLAYLRDLQRAGREVLAQATLPSGR